MGSPESRCSDIHSPFSLHRVLSSAAANEPLSHHLGPKLVEPLLIKPDL